jgi:hypothetical protein
MGTNRIEFVAPTKRAFEGMKRILFRPFDMQKWFILGFTAWLATLFEGGGGSGGSGSGSGSDEGPENESFAEGINAAIAWIQEHLTLILSIASVVILVVVTVSIVVLWLQSRGKLMFLDNVLHNRALVSEPWSQFRETANSLFRWKLVYTFIVFLIVIAFLGGGAVLAWPMVRAEAFDPSAIPVIIALSLGLVLVSLTAAYISRLLENFVVPLMYRDRVTASQAWRTFLAIHSANPGSFVVFFFWSILIGLGTAAAIFALVIGTCCIAAIPLMIPYLGTVLLLPIFVFLRLLGPEFLRQFGSEFDILIGEPTPPPLGSGATSPPEL